MEKYELSSLMNLKIEAIILDVDGTMLDTETSNATILRDFLNELGYNLPDFFVEWYFKNCSGNRYDKNLKSLQEQFGINFDSIKGFFDYRKECYKKNPPQAKKGLIELLDFLKMQGKKIAICTSATLDQTIIKLKGAGISLCYFDEIVDGSAVKEPKPHPQAYQVACKKLKVKPENALAFEDSDHGIESAYNAGLKVILVPDVKVNNPESEKLAWYKVTSLDISIPILNKIFQQDLSETPSRN